MIAKLKELFDEQKDILQQLREEFDKHKIERLPPAKHLRNISATAGLLKILNIAIPKIEEAAENGMFRIDITDECFVDNRMVEQISAVFREAGYKVKYISRTKLCIRIEW